MSSLFVGNLSSHIRHRELENVFRRFGRCNLELKEGFGFVVYEDHRDAKRALEALQGRSVCGEQPSISWARRRRPFQRFLGKGSFLNKERYYSRRRPSLETDRGSDDDRRDEKFVDDVRDDFRSSEVRDEPARSTERDAEWKDSGPDRLVFDEEAKDGDPLDSGRWDPRMDGSPDNLLVEGLLEGEHPSDEKDKEDERPYVHERSHESPRDRHHDRSSRIYRNSSDQHRRGRDIFGGRQQERCYNCGQSGHVKWKCRSRPRRINLHAREGGYDGRRNDLRYSSNRGGFRGMGAGSRFRGSNGARRFMARDMEPGYTKRSSTRYEANNDRKHLDLLDAKTRERSKRRHHRSESPKDSSSRGRSKRKHKKSSKKSVDFTKKRQRSSSSSPSGSQSQKSATSSLSRSQSHSESRSQSSKSGSQSPDSGSHSASSESQSSRSRSFSASSSSRSHSLSSESRKSASKSRSHSPVAHSPSPNSKRTCSPQSSSIRHSQSSTHDEKEVASSHRFDLRKEAREIPINDEKEERDDSKYHSESQDVDQHDAKRSERRRGWPKESKKQKILNRGVEEEFQEAELQSNGLNHTLKSIKTDSDQLCAQSGGMANDSFSRDSVSLKGSQAFQGQISDAECNMYVAIMKEGGGDGAGISQDWANLRFGAARLWPWEAMLYRRFKRGPISTANYERRKAQNEEFGIKDTFVRSSSGWWENNTEE